MVFTSGRHQQSTCQEPKKRRAIWSKELWDYLIREMAHDQASRSSMPERKSGWPKNWRMNDETYLYVDDSHKIEWLWHQRKWKTPDSKCSHPTDSFQQGGHLSTYLGIAGNSKISTNSACSFFNENCSGLKWKRC